MTVVYAKPIIEDKKFFKDVMDRIKEQVKGSFG